MIKMAEKQPKKIQFWTTPDFPLNNKETRIIVENIKKLFKYCIFKKEARIIYENVAGLKQAFEKLIPEEEDDGDE